jgi:pyruvate kinase
MKASVEPKHLHAAVEALIERCLALEARHAPQIDAIPAAQRPSARNLVHYLALRAHELRPLQQGLAALGLSSLGRAEAHVLASLRAVAAALCALRGAGWSPPAASEIDMETGPALLAANASRLLGSSHSRQPVRVMVTMPASAATDPVLVSDLVEAGMDIMRINCAHDDLRAWRGMVENLRRASAECERRCLVLMDLGGPKLRTGPIGGALRFRKLRPPRDALERVTAPLAVRFVAGEATTGDPAAVPLEGIDPTACRKGDVLTVVDSRDKRRRLAVVAVDHRGCVAETRQSLRLLSGARVLLERRGRRTGEGTIGALPPVAQAIVLRPGDRLDLTRPGGEGAPARLDAAGSVRRPARIPITLPEVFDCVKAGQRVFLDDGRFGGVVEQVRDGRIRVRITDAPAAGGKLRADKGINLPDTRLRLPALTPKDREDLAFVARHADLVGLSFVREPADVATLREALGALDASHLGIVLKIENHTAFEHLPALLLEGLRGGLLGVMVARGDLAVEVGYERLAELQEEILWLCEAAHVPVIWATQVLETLAQTGRPSRAEVTDAAMSGRAECVMLNKGPCIVEAVRFLENVLDRMARHQRKKSAVLRRLAVSRGSRRGG